MTTKGNVVNDHISKDHTEAYVNLNAVAERLHTEYAAIMTLDCRSSQDVQRSLARHYAREWDEAVTKAFRNHGARDVCAAITRLKDGKHWLTFLDPAHHFKAA